MWLMLMLCTGVYGHAQKTVYSVHSADDEIVLEIWRDKGNVMLSVKVSDSLALDYLTIERRPDFQESFTQCKYITNEDLKAAGGHILKKDVYAYPGSGSVMYRIKVSQNGGTRTYPAVVLPALGKDGSTP